MIAKCFTPALLAAALITPAALLSAPTSAEARRYVKPYYSWSYDTRRPVHGYEGFVFPDYYCSYKRFPKRSCSIDRRGRERCRVTGWTLEQTCQ